MAQCDCPNCADQDPIERSLNQMLSDASAGLQEAHKLFTSGQLDTKHIDWLLETRDALAQTLVEYEDGDGYTTLRPEYRNYATGAMRCLEEDASALHAAATFNAEQQQAA